MWNKVCKNRILGFVLALLLAIAVVPVNVRAATGITPSASFTDPSTGITWSDYDSVVNAYKKSTDKNGKVTYYDYHADQDGNLVSVTITNPDGSKNTVYYSQMQIVVADAAPAGPKQPAVVQVVSDISVFAKGNAPAITFTFPKRNVQSKYTELDSVRICTMKNADGSACWLGASQMTVDEKKITIDGSVFAQLTPGVHKIQFIFSDYAHAVAEITVLDASNFDGAFYAEKNPDVKAACGTDNAALFNHYAANGLAEKRVARAVK